MRCPHLQGWVAPGCMACDRPYRPSAFERKEYCTTESHRKCPFYTRLIYAFLDGIS